MYVCVCVCVCVCTYICVCVPLSACMYVCMYACVYPCRRVLRIHTHTSTKSCSLTHAHTESGFCLNNLTLSEKGVKKLLEENNFKAFADKLLHDDDVANSFMQVRTHWDAFAHAHRHTSTQAHRHTHSQTCLVQMVCKTHLFRAHLLGTDRGKGQETPGHVGREEGEKGQRQGPRLCPAVQHQVRVHVGAGAGGRAGGRAGVHVWVKCE